MNAHVISVLKGAAVAVIGALIPFLLTITNTYDFGKYEVWVGAGAAIAVNILRKLVIAWTTKGATS